MLCIAGQTTAPIGLNFFVDVHGTVVLLANFFSPPIFYPKIHIFPCNYFLKNYNFWNI